MVSMLPLPGFAQKAKGQKVLTLNYGFSYVGTTNYISDQIFYGYGPDQSIRANSKTGPVIFGFDYGLNKIISLGLFVSYENVNVKQDNYSYRKYTDSGYREATENLEYSWERIHFCIVPKIHLTPNNNKIDAYIGFKVGYQNSELKSNIDYDDNYKFGDPLIASRLTLGLFNFGTRYYFSDDLGVNAEIAIGAPSFFSFGGVYLFD